MVEAPPGSRACTGPPRTTSRRQLRSPCYVRSPGRMALGGLIGLGVTSASAHPVVSAFWFLLLGGLLAGDAKLSLRVTTALAALLGLYHGYLNGTGLGLSATSATVLLGLIFAVFVLVALAAALVVRLHASWARMAVRVAGSWIAGSGLLMLGWAMHKV
jgi:urease accessory protein